jgi:hypothetical protein
MFIKSIKDELCAFWDFFVLFSGVSTASNLSRTRKDRILTRGLFLFRPPRN